MRQNIVLEIAYDGTRYRGWQKVDPGPSIEETLESVLQTILQEEISLQAASRTDAGVHAEGQVVNFFSTKETIDIYGLKRSLNGLLPDDIAIKKVKIASFSRIGEKCGLDFHPTLDCVAKRYRYQINNQPVQSPHQRHLSWHIPKTLDLISMQAAAKYFIGEHDFAAFCNQKNNETYASTVRCIDTLEVKALPRSMVHIEVQGPNFLYKMVRNIVGTLVYVGLGKLSVDNMTSILQSKDRRLAGITAPAHGLILANIFYTYRE